MAGRPQLRIGTHGKIQRVYKGGGVWLARCRYRDADGVTRLVQKLGPVDEYDQHGKLAEDALIAALAERQRFAEYREIGPHTKVSDLVEQHLARLAEDGRSPVTMSTYRFTTTKLRKFIGGLRVSESSPARIDAALRSMRNATAPQWPASPKRSCAAHYNWPSCRACSAPTLCATSSL